MNILDGQLVNLAEIKSELGKVTRQNVVLPKLSISSTPNQSARVKGVKPYLVCIHRPVGSYVGSIHHLQDRGAEASAHIITEGNKTGVDVATQLVPWDRKAWSCVAFNSVTYNIEVDDNAWDGSDPVARLVAARLAGFICHKTRIPPKIPINLAHHPGIVSHYMLGRAGGGHTDPMTDRKKFAAFVKEVAFQVQRGGYRTTYGKGRFARI